MTLTRDDIENLTPDLFWDVSMQSVDPERHQVWLLGRVLEMGSWEDWRIIGNAFDRQELNALAPSLKISAKSRNFLRIWTEQ